MKKTKVITTAKGNKLTVIYEYKEKMIERRADLDGDIINMGKEPYISSKLTFGINGSLDAVHEENVINGYTSKEVANACAEIGVAKYYRGSTRYVLDSATVTKIDELIAEVKYLGRNEEVQAAMNEEAAEEAANDVKEAKAVLEEAKKTFRNPDGSLMTKSEAKEWRINYNTIHNEGQEGYVPHITTKEDVKWAESVIANR